MLSVCSILVWSGHKLVSKKSTFGALIWNILSDIQACRTIGVMWRGKRERPWSMTPLKIFWWKIVLIIVSSYYSIIAFFTKISPPSKSTGYTIGPRGKGLLKWEAKAKSRAGRTTQPQCGILNDLRTTVKMAMVLFLCPTNRFPSGVSWQIKDEERKGNNELQSQWLWSCGRLKQRFPTALSLKAEILTFTDAISWPAVKHFKLIIISSEIIQGDSEVFPFFELVLFGLYAFCDAQMVKYNSVSVRNFLMKPEK